MVLYKRKQVTFVRPPAIPHDLNTPIYIIPQTKEWFLEYEDYLARMDYYYRHKFVCEITGNSCLTFFEAYDSEQKEIKDVERNFPEALREHILRFLQFNRITRLDQLVDKVYLVFKSDYFPGEEVYVKKIIFTNGQEHELGERAPTYMSTIKQKGVIREKVQYSNPSDTKYLVFTNGEGQQIIATNQQISRDRNHFTKWLIKTFIKLTVTRSHKVGAPWVVKEKYAKKYRIPQVYPEAVRHYESTTPSGEILYEDDVAEASETPEPRGKKRNRSLKMKATLNAALNYDTEDRKDPRRFALHHLPEAVLRELDSNDQATLSLFQPSKKTIVDDLRLNFDLQNVRPMPRALTLPENARGLNSSAFERVKDDPEEADRLASPTLTAVQEALECWAFLNIYHSVLKLDTFTFDDFVTAMSWNADQYNALGRCELLDEIWCAVLCGLVSNEMPGKKYDPETDGVYGLRINLPSVSLVKGAKGDTDDMTDERGSDSEHESKTLKIEDDASENESMTGSPPPNGNAQRDDGHNAHAAMNYRGISWHERLRKRNFKDGNWQLIAMGVLSLVDYVAEYQPTIRRVYKTLAPPDTQPTPTTVLNEFYHSMGLDLRLKTLHILTTLLVNGTLVRHYIDESIENSITMRRTRLDTIRDLKGAVDAANKIHSALHDALVDASEHSQEPALATLSAASKKRTRLHTKGYEMNEAEKVLAASDANFQKLWTERDEAIEKVKELREAKKSVEMKLTELDCQRVRLLGKDRFYNRYWWFENNGLPNLHFVREDEEEEDAELETNDDDDEKDEVLEETYLMGKLWVQGPTGVDVLMNLKLDDEKVQSFMVALKQNQSLVKTEDNAEGTQLPAATAEPTLGDNGEPVEPMNFRNLPQAFICEAAKFDVQFRPDSITVNGTTEVIDKAGGIPNDIDVSQLLPMQRKLIEEAPEPLVSGNQWRYYDQTEHIEDLVKWLNPWGKRESTLRKELIRVKEAICNSITARRKALWLDKLPKEETEIESNIAAVDTKIEELKTTTDEISTALAEPEGSDEDSAPRKRPNRRKTNTPNKRQKTVQETIETGNLTDLNKLHELLLDDLSRKKAENHINRVLEWVNSTAQSEFERSMYDGADRLRIKGRKPKK